MRLGNTPVPCVVRFIPHREALSSSPRGESGSLPPSKAAPGWPGLSLVAGVGPPRLKANSRLPAQRKQDKTLSIRSSRSIFYKRAANFSSPSKKNIYLLILMACLEIKNISFTIIINIFNYT